MHTHTHADPVGPPPDAKPVELWRKLGTTVKPAPPLTKQPQSCADVPSGPLMVKSSAFCPGCRKAMTRCICDEFEMRALPPQRQPAASVITKRLERLHREIDVLQREQGDLLRRVETSIDDLL